MRVLYLKVSEQENRPNLQKGNNNVTKVIVGKKTGKKNSQKKGNSEKNAEMRNSIIPVLIKVKKNFFAIF